MNKELDQRIREICIKLFDEEIDPQITRPEEQFGDYSTNVALRLAGKLGKNPAWIAGEISEHLKSNQDLADANVAGAGFINIKLSDQALIKALEEPSSMLFKDKTVVMEFSDPNPFKVLHAGHLYTSIIGESISRIIEASGAKVHRVNYGGDVGLHVAKTMWAILNKLGGEHPDKLNQIPAGERSQWLADCYVEGASKADDSKIATEITGLNKKIYQLHDKSDKSSPFAKIYWTARDWSYDYFEDFYKQIDIKFEKYYAESQVYKLGLEKIKGQIGSVYEESDGAVVFRGEKDGLHTRVFITREGLPTYEAKEVGLAFLKKAEYDFDLSVIVTANEIMQYMQVVQKSISLFAPEMVENTRHINHGVVKLPGGVKMSSRKGNILKAADLIDLAKEANAQQNNSKDPIVSLGAIKYAFLKNRIGGDTIYDPDQSVSLEGNSGPYIQYALTRGKSIISKADSFDSNITIKTLEPAERSLARKLSEYPDVYQSSLNEFAPHYICGYLFELCQVFNRFYESNRVLDDPRSKERLKLVDIYCRILEKGLDILGVEVPEKM
ncbi:MAG TPA: arginine--tRNA ligase [Candidatus Saccharimonadales bacterium]|nr:arginine--tRNA ligase [Candidatus Saccharimonadales bacterium]